MAIQTEPTRIQIPFADSGTKNVIPDTNSTPSASQAASWTDGFPAQCSLPLSAGGIPPARADFNGIFNTMTQSERFTQEGGVWAWDATVDYGTNRVVLGSDGLLYWSVAQSGPNLGGAQNPTTDNGTYWTAPTVKQVSIDDRSGAAVSTNWITSWFTDLMNRGPYYVDPVNGDDANSGLSSGSPMKTVQAVYNKIANLPFVSSTTIINLAAGTYGEDLRNTQTRSAVWFIGPDSGFASFTSGYFIFGSTTEFRGRIQLLGTLQISLNATVRIRDGAVIDFNDLGSVGSAIFLAQNAIIVFTYHETVSVSFTGTNSFSNATIQTTTGGKVDVNGNYTTFSGTVSGKRYACTLGSGIGGTGSTTKIPGSVAGTTDSTSYYS